MNCKSLITIIITLCIFFVPAQLRASIREQIQKKIQSIFAKYKGDRSLESGLKKILTSKAYLGMTDSENLKLLTMIDKSRSVAGFVSSHKFNSAPTRELRLALHVVISPRLPRNRYALNKLRSLIGNRPFYRLPGSIRRYILKRVCKNPANLYYMPSTFEDARNYFKKAKAIKKAFGTKVGGVILTVAADFPGAVKDIEEFAATQTFATADFKFHNVTGATKRSLLERKAMMLRVIATLSAYKLRVSSDAQKLIRNTVKVLAHGNSSGKTKLLLRMRNYGDDGQADGSSVYIKVNASRFTVTPNKISNGAQLVDTLVHEVNHCTRKVNMANSNYETMMDEYAAWYVGTFARLGKRPTGAQMYKIYKNSIKKYAQYTGASSTDKQRFDTYCGNQKNSTSGAASFDKSRYDELNTFTVQYSAPQSFASLSTPPSPSVASASPAETDMGLLGMSTGAVNSPQGLDNTPEVDLASFSSEGANDDDKEPTSEPTVNEGIALTNFGDNGENTLDDGSFETYEDGDEPVKADESTFHG